MRFEVLKRWILKLQFSEMYQSFGGTCCLHLQYRDGCSNLPPKLCNYQTKRRYIPEIRNLNWISIFIQAISRYCPGICLRLKISTKTSDSKCPDRDLNRAFSNPSLECDRYANTLGDVTAVLAAGASWIGVLSLLFRFICFLDWIHVGAGIAQSV
jgi:hypothetical protein